MNKNEPARQKAYRQLYHRIKDRLDRLDDVVMHLVQRIDRLQKRDDTQLMIMHLVLQINKLQKRIEKLETNGG